MSSRRLDPAPGFAPGVGRLVGVLEYSRASLVSAAQGLSRAELDHLHDDRSNSIGALLAHVAAIEWWFQVLTFEERRPAADEEAPRLAALDLGAEGRRVLRGRDLAHYLEALGAVRARTLAELAKRDDAWLDQPCAADAGMNAWWAWFHVAEDETSHRGQIRWLRSRLPARTSP